MSIDVGGGHTIPFGFATSTVDGSAADHAEARATIIMEK